MNYKGRAVMETSFLPFCDKLEL